MFLIFKFHPYFVWQLFRKTGLKMHAVDFKFQINLGLMVKRFYFCNPPFLGGNDFRLFVIVACVDCEGLVFSILYYVL